MDRNIALRRRFIYFHVVCADLPTPEEAKIVIFLLKDAMGPAGIKVSR